MVIMVMMALNCNVETGYCMCETTLVIDSMVIVEVGMYGNTV